MTLFQKTLVPLDGSDMAERILPAAGWFAHAFGGTLQLLHIIEPGVPSTVHADRHLTNTEEAEAYLHAVARSITGLSVATHVHTPLLGQLPKSIAAHTTELGTDTIAMTTHGYGGFSRILFGSKAERTLAQSRLPMLVAPVHLVCPLRHYACARILAPVDLDPAHDIGIDVATTIAAQTRAHLILAAVAADLSALDTRRHAWSRMVPAAASALLEVERVELENKLAERKSAALARGIAVETTMMTGDVEAELLNSISSSNADLVVLTTHMHRGLEARWHTSMTSALAGSARAHLLLVPAK